MAANLYVDTSAYLCVLLGETGAALLARELAGARLRSSVLLVLEARRTLVCLSREGVLSAVNLQACLDRIETDTSQFALRDLTLDLCRDPTMPVVSTPRSLDLVHLRTAMWFHGQEPLTRFVSTNASQNQSARELGLPT
jgi:hypothetical protein